MNFRSIPLDVKHLAKSKVELKSLIPGNATGSGNESGNGGNGDGDSENAGQTCPNSTSDGAVAFPPISTPNPGKSSSYANVTGKPSMTKVNFLTLFTPAGNGIDVVVPHPDVNLLKEDVGNVPVWVKLYGVPVMAFSEDGLSAIATKLVESNIVVAMPKITREGFYTCNIHVEYEWKPSRCACCKVFGHFQEECPKNIGAGETKNLKKPSQTPRGISLVRSGTKKKNMKPTKEVSQSNPFDVLTSVENDVDLVVLVLLLLLRKLIRLKKLIIDGKVTLVDDEGKPLEKIESSGGYDSEDEVASIDNEMASFFARKDGYGTNSLPE
ncbi:putative reverse transcriptase domain-containing protein [Tanacetum coccineum]